MILLDNCSHKFEGALLLSGSYWIGGDENDSDTELKTVGKGQKTCPKGVLQLLQGKLPFAGQRRGM